jgi:hypothetical protein
MNLPDCEREAITSASHFLQMHRSQLKIGLK